MTAYDAGILILRLALAVTLAAHGFIKFSGPEGLAGTAGMFESIGFKPGALNARLAATAEVAAGLGLAVGLLTPLSAAGFVALMLVAAWTVHRSNGFFVTQSGWEYNFVLAAAAVGAATLGPGRISLDWLLFGATDFYEYLHGWWGLLISVVVGLLAAIVQMTVFYRPKVRA